MKSFYTIPVFIPEMACPHRCVFCNQHSITSVLQAPGKKETRGIIEKYLSTIPTNKTVDIGFLGGNFTGIPLREQETYLQIARPYLQQGRVGSLRVSTRPDYIDEKVLALLSEYGVTTIELGAQSMRDDVLQKAGRGHSVADTTRAAKLIKQSGFSLGLQMMTGLPGDSDDGARHTTKRIIELGASNTRIYPTLVLKGTHLEELWQQKAYRPQTLEETVALLAELLPLFEENRVDILRTGLHPTEGFLNGNDLLDGPFHPALKALALSRIWKKKIEAALPQQAANRIEIAVNPADIPHAVGYQSENKKLLQKRYRNVVFKQDAATRKGACHVDCC